MSIATNLLFLHGYVATPDALAAVAPPSHPVSAKRAAEPVVEVRDATHEAPLHARAPWRPGPFVLVDALCGTAPPAQFRVA